MPRSDNQGAAVNEYRSGQWVELLLRKGHKLEDAIEQLATAQERLPVRVRTEWEKFPKEGGLAATSDTLFDAIWNVGKNLPN